MPSAGTVTLLFTDLVGSTEILDQIGDDAAERLRRTHFRLLRDAVAANGGHEVKSLGDGLMVVFSSALDAVGCAVNMQQAVDHHNHWVAPLRGASNLPSLNVRIGLHAGEPIRDEEDYYGTPVVIAKRLCDEADGGQILASDLVRGLVASRGGFQFLAMGPMLLKGLAEPLQAYDIAWQPLSAPGFALPPQLETRPKSLFVGRDDELSVLRTAWDHVGQAKRRLVFIAGEPGIGKTRIATEFALDVHATGATVLYGRCDEEAIAPYRPFVEALRHYASNCSQEDFDAKLAPRGTELARLVPEVEQRMGVEVPPGGDLDGERYRLFEAVGLTLSAISESEPLVLLLDDLQWADRPTLLLLKHVIRSPESARLLVIGTYRDTDLHRGHRLSDVLGDLRREHLFERVLLRGLAEENVGAIVNGWTGASAPTEFTHAVHAETEGNPFFVEEVMRHLQETGAIGPGKYQFAPEAGIPEGLREVIGRRLSRLSAECNRVLQFGSVFGRDFQFEPLMKVTGLAADELLDALDEAVEAQVIRETPNVVGHYSFGHAVIRQALYSELTTTRRVRLHRIAGDALSQVYGAENEDRFGEYARHYFESAVSGTVDEAIYYSRRAGECALAKVAYEEAIDHFERALHVVEDHEAELPARARLDLLLALGDAQRRAGEPREAMPTLERAAQIARELGDGVAVAQAAVGYEEAFLQTGTRRSAGDAAMVLIAEGLDLVGEGTPELRARLLAARARAQYFGGQVKESVAVSELAMQVARASGDRGALLAALNSRRITIWGPYDLDERLAVAEEFVKLAEEVGHLESALEGRKWLITALIERGDIEAAEEEVERYARGADMLQQPWFLYYTPLLRAMIATLHGNFSDAERLSLDAMAIGREAQSGAAVFQHWSQMMILRWFQGRLDEMEQAAAMLREHFSPVAGNPATIYVERGDFERARDHWNQLTALGFETFPRDYIWSGTLAYWSVACHRLKDKERAREMHELLRHMEGQFVVAAAAVFCLGSASRFLALLSETFGDLDEAARLYEDALAGNERLRAWPSLAVTQLEYACMLQSRGREEDRAKALGLLERARAAAETMGMAGIADQAAEALADARAARVAGS
jgi:class 3 adenylate cyclase/tetratricopeptide (TPR) repeat protein